MQNSVNKVPMATWLYDYHNRIDVRALFQNADGTINMVKLFPKEKSCQEDCEDLAWFRILADIMLHTYTDIQNSSTGRLITLDEKRGYMSCYVELHRSDFICSLLYGLNSVESTL